MGTVLTNFASEQATSKPQYVLILITIVIITLIYSQRLFNINNPHYNTLISCFLMAIMSIIILSTFLNVLKITDSQHVNNFNEIFNSPGSRNYFAVFVLLLFIMFVYELPVYDNNNPHVLIDKLTFGHNKFISNKLLGLLLIISFCITTGYVIHSTTREH